MERGEVTSIQFLSCRSHLIGVRRPKLQGMTDSFQLPSMLMATNAASWIQLSPLLICFNRTMTNALFAKVHVGVPVSFRPELIANQTLHQRSYDPIDTHSDSLDSLPSIAQLRSMCRSVTMPIIRNRPPLSQYKTYFQQRAR